jgi:thiamine pyrophosphate-dependent acetolactate synthase large subunit-like protein
MQASHTNSGVDLVAVAKACRFKEARAVSANSEVERARRMLHAAEGPVFIQAHVEAENLARVLPTRDGSEIKFRFMQALAKLS